MFIINYEISNYLRLYKDFKIIKYIIKTYKL